MTKKQKKILVRIIIAIILVAVGYALPIKELVKSIIFSTAYIISGYDVLYSAARNIIHGQIFDEKFLMTVATLGAFGIKEFPEAAFVMIFYQIGELLQGIAVGKSRKSVTELLEICPETATVLHGDKETEVLPDEIEIGDTVIIKAGEKIPVDGVIIFGETTVNTAALTGESVPCVKSVGDSLISGCINISGTVKMAAQTRFEDSTVSKILELIETSSEKKAKVEGFITRFARYYTPCVVISALILAVMPPLFFRLMWSEWINRALIFLVVSCPCALVVSVPLSFFSGISSAAKKGILIKGSNYLELLTKADTVVFDKTGTLTEGVFSVGAIHPSSVTAAQLLDIAAIAESYSTHPIGESIVAAYSGCIDKKRLNSVMEISGMGVCAEIDSRLFYVGNAALMKNIGSDYHECHLSGTVIHISENKNYLGHIVVNDKIKANSAEAVRRFKKFGITNTVMLTGDKLDVAREVCEKTGVDSFKSGLMPEDKVREIEKIINSGKKVVFVGDGINDAPVLMRSDVGIAMGSLGSDAAIESSDIVLMDDDPLKISTAISIADKTVKIVKENIIFALSVKAIVLILGALGFAGMWFAVFGDVGVTVIAVINSLRAGSDL